MFANEAALATFATCALSLINNLSAVLVELKLVPTKAILEFVFPNAAKLATFATSALFAIALFVLARAASVTTFAT